MKSLYFVAVPIIALLASQSAFSQSISYTDAAANGDYSASINPSGGGGTSEAMAVIWYTNRANFQAAVPGLCNKEDFEASTAAPVGVHNEPLWVCTNDVDIQPGDIEGGFTMRSSGGNLVVTLAPGLIGQPSVVAGANTFAEFTNMGFCVEPTGVGFDVYSNGGAPDPVDIRVYDCFNNLLGVNTVGANNATGTFIGVEVTPGTNPIWRIEVESMTGAGELVDDMEWNGHCDPTLAADNKYVQSGQSLELAISETAPSARALLYVTAVNGVPFLVKVFGPISVFPQWCSGSIVVPPAPTVNVDLTAFVIDPVNGVTITNTKTIFIN